MRDGRRRFPVARAAAGVLAHPVSILQAPPGMDGVGVVAASALDVDAGPVVLVAAEEPTVGIAERLKAELDRLGSAGPAVIVLTRTGVWTLEEQSEATREMRRHPRVTVVLVTGTDRAFPVAPGLVLFSGRDLVLDAEDVATFAQQRRLDADTAVLDRLHRLTGGWPGLLQIAVDAMQEWPVPAAAGLDVAEPAVRHEVRRRLLPWLPAAWWSTAAHLAVAGSASSAELAAGADAGVPVATLARHGIAVPRGDGTTVGLLEPLGNALIDELAATDPARLRTLRGRISDLRAELGEGDCGLSLAVTMQDWSRCAAILANHLPTLLTGTPAGTLRATLAALPESCFRTHPLLLRQAELFAVTPPGRQGAPAAPAGRAAGGAAAAPTVSRSRVLEEGALVAAAHRRRGDLDLALRLIDDVDPVAYQVDLDRAGADRVPMWHLHAGFTRLLAGDETGAARSLQAGWALRSHAPAAYGNVLALELALRHALRGEHLSASHWAREAERHPAPVDGAFIDARPLRAVPTLIGAVDALQPTSGVTISGIDHHDDRWPFLAWAQSLAALNEGRVADALLLLEPPDGRSRHVLHHALLTPARANAHLAAGHGNRASAELDALPVATPRSQAVRARLHLLTGSPDLALAETTALATDQTVPLRISLEVNLLHAASLLATGDESAAAATARSTVSRALAQGHSRVLLGIPAGIAGALAELVDGLGATLAELYARCGGPLYPEEVLLVRLTERETAVLRGLRLFERLDDLATDLHVSRNTVKSQLRSLYAKLGVHSREEAVRMAQRHRLID